MMSRPPNRRRSRRLRKKLHIGEFQEWGFEYEVRLPTPLSPLVEDALIDRFLEEVIERRGLGLGGGVSGGFVSSYGRGSATEEDRAAVQAWLSSNLKAEVIVGPLIDAWYLERQP